MKITDNTSPESSSKFSINSSYQGFTDRQKNIFDQLNIAECNSRNSLQNNNAYMEVDDSNDAPVINERPRLRHFQGKESIFKKPQARPPRHIANRRIPDYQIHPHKWTKYSLGDVKSEDMSEHANTAAAMSFLKEMQLRKSQDQDASNSKSPDRIVFKKLSSRVEKDECSSGAIFKNTKVIMPEYVVGQKKAQKRKQKKVEDGNATKEVKLGHLHEEDGDEEDV